MKGVAEYPRKAKVFMNNIQQTYTVLGAGANVACRCSMAPSHLLQWESGAVLIDIGRGCLNRLWDLSIDPLSIHRVCLTHFHADHTGELVSWLMGQYHNGDGQKLYLVGGPGLKVWWRCLCAVWPSLERLERFDLLELTEINAGRSIIWDGCRVDMLTVNHKPESLAYKFTYNDSVVVIAGDTGLCTELSDFAHKADLLVLECGAGVMAEELMHLNAYQAADIAQKAAAGKLILHHIPDNTVEADLAHAIKSIYNNPFYIASDLLQVEV